MDLKTLAGNLGLEVGEFLELVELFVETATNQIESIKKALQAEDNEEVARIAHSLKGAAGNLGFNRIYEMAQAITSWAREKQLAKVSEKIPEVEKEIEKVTVPLKENNRG